MAGVLRQPVALEGEPMRIRLVSDVASKINPFHYLTVKITPDIGCVNIYDEEGGFIPRQLPWYGW
jgi:hypothetical protein